MSVSTVSRSLKISTGTNVRRNHSCNLRQLIWRLPRACHPQRHGIRSGFSSSSSAAICLGSAGNKLPREFFLVVIRREHHFGFPTRYSTRASPSGVSLKFICGASGSGGGGDGLGVGNGGEDGDGGSSGGGTETKSISGESEDVSNLGSDVIILDVGGMSCGGCAASVKRILESLPQVSSANVNLATETAVVWATSEAKVTRDWQQDLGQKLASHLTTCGFQSNLRDSSRKDLYRIFEKKMDEKLVRLKESGRGLVVSWTLCAVCLLGHTAHLFQANAPSWLHALHSTGFHLSLSFLTLIGPGRQLILDGIRSLFKGSPNMNTLVGLGALSSFAVSSVAAFVPKLGWKVFFEEPIMLIAFVLLGKNLEQRAKLKATSDMTGLMNILPLQLDLWLMDRVPVDGTVKTGRSTVDESSFTGEPLPVTKLPGSEVTAGSINLNGTLTIESKAWRETWRQLEWWKKHNFWAFTYGVMAFSAATFMFWNLLGPHLVPAALQQGSPISLGITALPAVVACPCALGLATPTAVMVGTSIGAARGLLIRGGNVLENFAGVDTIVFDKTGTLTNGKPMVTKVLTFESEGSENTGNVSSKFSENEILRLAAGVESNTIHPVGKAIVEAAKTSGCHNAKVDEGTFHEEPGSGVTAIVEQKRVTVGTSEWLGRHGVYQNPRLDVEELENQSTVYVGVDGNLAGVLYFEDKIREDARQVIESLSKQGISIYMLSGDRKSTAEHVASVVGIDKNKVISSVKPDEKKNFISELRSSHKVVAMVGDGVNDAAALASAGVGIAMGSGVGAASDVSSIVLMGNRLSQLLEALELSKSTMKTVRQNLCWAFGYNIVGIPVAAGVLLPLTGTILTPSIAGALMGLSSVGVMANSLLLRFRLGSKRKPSHQIRPHMESESPSGSEELAEPQTPRWKNT
ncbi:unnamed protein product [Spirodela intermedia]|uniref:HMA domain-containing protein n=1 Tax=Spirodela intermedia TaxID=51605 RepID=A0A7I8J6H5_SPIIN|nr:unnamed protein product [Spirodela intermedia]CAA6665042.1 unnamed protein product [Spirodela intermedia]